MSSAIKRPGGGRQPYRLPLLLIVFCSLILLVQLCTSEGVSIDRYRQGYRSGNSVYYDDLSRIKEIFNEPLYIKANASVKVYPPKNIAVIGGGMGGVSIAHSFGPESRCVNFPQVTIFEKEGRLGGRIHSVPKYDEDDCEVAEAGGYTFDWRTYGGSAASIAEDVGVPLQEIYPGEMSNDILARVGAWNGEELIESQYEPAPTLWTYLKKLPSQVAMYICEKRWGDTEECEEDWSWTVPKPITQVNKGASDAMQKFAELWGIDIWRHKKTYPERGGNAKLLKRAVRLAEAELNLNSTVSRIVRHEDLTFDIHWTKKSPDGQTEAHVDQVDAVVIAAPFYQTNITIEPPLPSPPAEVNYTPLHVTHFITRHRLDPKSFNKSQTNEIPDTILNLNGDKAQHATRPSSLPSFLAITREDSSYAAGCTIDMENQYRIISLNPISDSDIANLMNASRQAPEDVTFPHQACYPIRQDWIMPLGVDPPEPDYMYADFEAKAAEIKWHELEGEGDDGWYLRNIGCVTKPTVRWVHRRYWPNGIPLVNHDAKWDRRIELAPRLFYVNGFEGFEGASISQSGGAGQRIMYNLLYNYIDP
ncbi:hypothetical protein BDV36DRAFT_304379 [Aspergillus pseudocaelatus]|uniref:Prenylcysteine lyase domain-containing protein n=1 Tax=Aspergillus pseudocaelatus TaxID=1825620 RepID=A0ABQ6X0U4_9EURO|nr:hypothetical protein BDV36DRAFT_304379 [Aspergillus pseudocaelatus]